MSLTGSSILPISPSLPPSTAVYCSTDDVARLLGFGTGYFTDNTTPSLSDVTGLIAQAQDMIDDLTGHAWRLRQSRFEYHEMARLGRRTSWFLWPGYPIDLNHRMVQPINGFTVLTTSQLTAGTPYTTIPIAPLTYPVTSGTTVVLSDWPNTQTTTLSTAAVAGATSLTVASITPTYTFPSSSNMMTFSPLVGDFFQVMVNYNSWQDWSGGNYYNVNWWGDWANGRLYISYAYLGMRQFSVRAQFHYGEVDANLQPVVARDIQLATSYYVASMLLVGADKWKIMPQNANNIIQAREKEEFWMKQFDLICLRRSEWSAPH